MNSTKPLNLVFIFTDQQRYDTMAAYGNTQIKTPNFNNLADKSAVFEKAYVTQPVCTPSRASIITGLYPHSHGLVTNNMCLDEDKPSIAKMVKKYGYKTAYYGKWHLGNEVVAQHGFDDWRSFEDGYRKHYNKEEYKSINSSYYHFLRDNGFMPDEEDGDFKYFSRDFATRLPEKFSKPAYTTNEAVDYINNNKDEKFVLYVNYLEPHAPYYSAFDDMYDPDEVPLPPCFDFELGPDRPLKYELKKLHTREVGRHYPIRDERSWRKHISKYWGSVSLIDKCTGRILDAISKNDLEDNTIVVFTSDHGDMMGDYRLLAKGVMFEQATRVPMLIKIPGITDEQIMIKEPVSQIDLVPTLLDIMGMETTDMLEGKSLLPVINSSTSLINNDVFIEYQNGPMKKGNSMIDEIIGNMPEGDEKKHAEDIIKRAAGLYGTPVAERAVVTPDGFKLVLRQSHENELYDLNNDPYEQVNLYYIAGYTEQIERLKDKILKWQIKTGDKESVI